MLSEKRSDKMTRVSSYRRSDGTKVQDHYRRNAKTKMFPKEEIDEVYGKYKKQTNMTASELEEWSKTSCSQKASLSRSEESEEARKERRKLLTYVPESKRKQYSKFKTAQIRNLVLKKIPKKEWDSFLTAQANKANSYLGRAKKIRSKNKIEGCGTKNSIALKNWAYDKNK
ncbi:MAG: hypothetical protein ACE5RP_00195 [Nitrosopumilus sp.]